MRIVLPFFVALGTIQLHFKVADTLTLSITAGGPIIPLCFMKIYSYTGPDLKSVEL